MCDEKVVFTILEFQEGVPPKKVYWMVER